MKNIIITGANGFIGSALCRSLTEQGYHVTAVVKDEMSNCSRLSGLPNLKIKFCKLSKIDTLAEQLSEKYDTFYHLAWEGSSGEKRGNVEKQLDNVQSTCRAVETSKRLGCKRFVFAASIMEYEVHKAIQEYESLGRSTIYSTGKLAADFMAHAVAADMGIEYISALISNVYGPGENSSRLINSSIRQLLKGEKTAFTPGEQLYDFIYVSDAAKMFAAIGECGKNHKIYYIGSGKPRPLKEFLSYMGEITAPGVDIGIGVIPFQGTRLTYEEFDMKAVERDTGVVPVVSFQEGIQRTVAAIREEFENEGI